MVHCRRDTLTCLAVVDTTLKTAMTMMMDCGASACDGAQPGSILSAPSNHAADWRYLKADAITLVGTKPTRVPSRRVVRAGSTA